MTDRLGEALAMFPYDQMPDDPTAFHQEAFDAILAAARAWHTLTNHDEGMVERIADAILRRQFPQSKPHILDEIVATYTDKSAYRADAHAVVDALTVTPTTEETPDD